MKKLLILLFISSSAFAQNKKDNTIVLPGYHSLSEIKDVLFKNNYAITNTDTAYLATSSKEIGATSIKLLINRTGDAIMIKGLIKYQYEIKASTVETASDFTPLYFGGMNKSPLRKAWNEMDKVAKQISPDIEYTSN